MHAYKLLGLGLLAAIGTSAHFVNAQDGKKHGGQHGHSPHGGQPAATLEEGRFPTVGFEETHEVTVPFPLADVQPLFEPQVHYHW